MGQLQQFISELRRRRVIRVLVGWGVFSFAVLQIYEPVMHGLHLPEWTLSVVVLALAAGFPATVVLAWIFDVKAGGIERTHPAVDENQGSASTSRMSGWGPQGKRGACPTHRPRPPRPPSRCCLLRT